MRKRHDDWDYDDWAEEAGQRYEQDAIMSKSILADTLLEAISFLLSNYVLVPKEEG